MRTWQTYFDFSWDHYLALLVIHSHNIFTDTFTLLLAVSIRCWPNSCSRDFFSSLYRVCFFSRVHCCGGYLVRHVLIPQHLHDLVASNINGVQENRHSLRGPQQSMRVWKIFHCSFEAHQKKRLADNNNHLLIYAQKTQWQCGDVQWKQFLGNSHCTQITAIRRAVSSWQRNYIIREYIYEWIIFEATLNPMKTFHKHLYAVFTWAPFANV